MPDKQPQKIKLPADARPYKGTTVVIENDEERTVIWLELDKHSYQVRKIKEFKGQSRH
jgi:hypothetical protein